MWNYYGSKSKIAKIYPFPKYNLIIEPFAGTAWYSVLYRYKKVILNEYYDVIYNIWNWLINKADPELILENKDFYVGDDVRETNLDKPHRDLIGFCINRGSVSPGNFVQKWCCQVASHPTWASTPAYSLKRIARILPEIRHWQVQFGNYEEIPNVEATWFIDPPYQFEGDRYLVSDIDYLRLAEWCKTRKGQVIVCENTKASWLPFRPLVEVQGQKTKTVEAIWTK